MTETTFDHALNCVNYCVCAAQLKLPLDDGIIFIYLSVFFFILMCGNM